MWHLINEDNCYVFFVSVKIKLLDKFSGSKYKGINGEETCEKEALTDRRARYESVGEEIKSN